MFEKTAVKFDENAEDREALHEEDRQMNTKFTEELERLEELMHKN